MQLGFVISKISKAGMVLWDRFLGAHLIAYFWRSCGVSIGARPLFCGWPILNVVKGARIRIGDDFVARSRPHSNSIGTQQPVVFSALLAKAAIDIGNDVRISGCSISCREYIRIHDRVGLGSGAIIMDNDAHPLDPNSRFQELPEVASEGICLEQDVWVGAHAIILKGTTIGARSIVQAGSVVRGTFPSDCIIAGNPGVVVNVKR